MISDRRRSRVFFLVGIGLVVLGVWLYLELPPLPPRYDWEIAGFIAILLGVGSIVGTLAPPSWVRLAAAVGLAAGVVMIVWSFIGTHPSSSLNMIGILAAAVLGGIALGAGLVQRQWMVVLMGLVALAIGWVAVIVASID